MLAGRYRIIGLLGRGGMGEVYRADDLKLGRPVALKLLPGDVERDPGRLERFLNEVRLSLQVTHPNVCRVFDIGEVDGRHYLSMEYVDGEDLASLLRRIGRLPQDKAVEIARQLCAGVQAAHEEGILHRDLKPANVMIDGRGRAKITDFGLAGAARGIEGVEARAGTPGYMAPEQLAGERLTPRTDLYALGLVLYELFTGKAAFESSSPTETMRTQRDTTPSNPSSHVAGLDPAVERTILRCLEPEPDRRPESALAVAAGLPGGDPLAAALAAGETPSPEMVADAGALGGLRPAIAIALLVAALVGLAAAVFLDERVQLTRFVPLPKSPTELAGAAREVIEAAGWTESPRDRAWGWSRLDVILQAVMDADDSADRWKTLATVRPSPVNFWYRQSPRHLVPANFAGSVDASDPPRTVPGMVRVNLDPEGRFHHFGARPPDQLDTEDRSGEPDWTRLFELAGLNPGDFEESESLRVPPMGFDARRAWTGSYPGTGGMPVTIEAASMGRRVVFFDVAPESVAPSTLDIVPQSTTRTVQNVIFGTVVVAVVLGGALLARRNSRLGRGDRRGAFRLAVFVFIVWLAYWLFAVDHVPTTDELRLLAWCLSASLYQAVLAWLFYMAVEPYVRRLWPAVLIAWSRLLDGRLTDPLLGRHILIGALCGTAVEALQAIGRFYLPVWRGHGPPVPSFHSLMLDGLPEAGSLYFSVLASALATPLWAILFALLLRVVLRRNWLAIAVLVALFSTFQALGSVAPIFEFAVSLSVAAIIATVMFRLGIFALVVSMIYMNIEHFALTFDPSSWYFGRSLVAILVLVGIVVYGFYISLAGRPIMSDAVFRDRTA
jgi:serine/threonine-protein kinase